MSGAPRARIGAALGAIDRWQRRRRWAAVIVGVGRKYTEDGAANHGARIAYYAFFSIFPLLLAFVSILGFVLQDQPELRRDILESTYADMPVVGPLIRGDIRAIGGSGIALAIGIVAAVWAGLGVTLAFEQGLSRVWGIPPLEQPGYVAKRLRGLATLLIGGAGIVASAILGGAATSGRLGSTLSTIASILLSVAVDAFLILVAFRLLMATPRRVRELLPGVVTAALGLLVLQALGGLYINAVVQGASDTYGLFATVIGLLSWLSLAAQLMLISAELNAVLGLGLWPRSLTGPMTDADRAALESYARSTLRDPRQRISVSWVEDASVARRVGAGGPSGPAHQHQAEDEPDDADDHQDRAHHL